MQIFAYTDVFRETEAETKRDTEKERETERECLFRRQNETFLGFSRFLSQEQLFLFF